MKWHWIGAKVIRWKLWAFGLVAFYLLMPFRFSEPVITLNILAKHDIIGSLQPNARMPFDPYQEYCLIDEKMLQQWEPPSPDEEFSPENVEKGGRWRPNYCQPKFDGEFFL